MLDVRYAGQGYELSVPFAPGWARAFHRLHARRFGHADPSRPLEVVTLRLRARGGRAHLPVDPPPHGGRARPFATRPVLFDGRPLPTRVYHRDDLPPGTRLRAPAIVCEYSATTLAPPGWQLRVDRLGGLLLSRP
jgi:N-methylhydantoinase A